MFAGLAGATLAIAGGKLSGTYGGQISVNLTSIKSVSVSQGFFGKLLGFGTVLIATPSGTKSLGFIANPEAFAGDLEDAAAAAKKASKPAAKAAAPVAAPAPAPVAAPAPAPVTAPIAAPSPEVLHVERTVAPVAPVQAAEAAKQSTTSDEDSYKGKTVAMSMEEFEALLKAQTEKQ